MKTIVSKLNIQNVLAILLSIVGILYSFLNIFYGIDFLDTFYMGNIFLHTNEVDIMRPLTQMFANIVSSLFGKEIIYLRITNWLFYIGSILILYWYARRIQFIKSNYLILGFSFLCIPLIGTNVYNGNSTTLLSLVLVIISLNECLTRDRLISYCAFLFSLTLSILARFPNIVLLPILSILLPFVCDNKKQYFKMLSTIILSFVSYFLILSLSLGGFESILETLGNKLSHSENYIEGANHSVGFLFQEYLHTIKDIVSNIKFLSLISVIPFISLFFKNKNIKYSTIIVYILFITLFTIKRVPIISDVIHYFLMMHFYAWIFVLFFVLITFALVRKKIKEFGFYLVLLLVSATGASGSDTGLYYMGAPMIVLLPYLLCILYRYIRDISPSEVYSVIIGLIMLSISAFVYCREGMQIYGALSLLIALCTIFCINSYLKLPLDLYKTSTYPIGKISSVIPLCIFIVLGIYAEYNTPFLDKGINQLNTYNKHKYLRGLKTSNEKSDYINNILDLYNKFNPINNVVFFGKASPIFAYLTEEGMIEGVDFAQNDTRYNTKLIENKVSKNRQTIFLIPSDPTRHIVDIKEEFPILINMVQSYNYEQIIEDTYAIFYPKEKYSLQ